MLWKIWQRLPTYMWELMFAAGYITCTVLVTSNRSNSIMFVGQVASACAVFVGFLHMQVASRLEEAAATEAVPAVQCAEKLTVYATLKELLWICAFCTLKAWPALAGVPLFLMYPVWRRFYRRLQSRHNVSV